MVIVYHILHKSAKMDNFQNYFVSPYDCNPYLFFGYITFNKNCNWYLFFFFLIKCILMAKHNDTLRPRMKWEDYVNLFKKENNNLDEVCPKLTKHHF